ncbi:MAG: hypothetical protein HOI79_01420 [Euryarchaeota archaeon]|jgi:signal recognition particle subunit SEC65|nr:hypothetical protein [Euryarchaeota archaeon]MBT5660713.1 hypothetical protein [Euryarchaeota archaeon]
MDHNPDRLCIWPGYFDMKISRRNGRRVPKDSSVLKPDLEGLFMAARQAGLKKIKREEHTSHPSRPHGKEGRLWVSAAGAKSSIGAGSKEEVLQLIGGQWRQMQRDQRNQAEKQASQGPQTGDRRARSQRKAPTQQRSGGFKKRSKFKK